MLKSMQGGMQLYDYVLYTRLTLSLARYMAKRKGQKTHNPEILKIFTYQICHRVRKKGVKRDILYIYCAIRSLLTLGTISKTRTFYFNISPIN
jgi:hypothetical protein